MTTNPTGKLTRAAALLPFVVVSFWRLDVEYGAAFAAGCIAVAVVLLGLLLWRAKEMGAVVKDDGIEVRSWFRTRLFAWSDLSAVEYAQERRWWGHLPMGAVIVTRNGARVPLLRISRPGERIQGDEVRQEVEELSAAITRRRT